MLWGRWYTSYVSHDSFICDMSHSYVRHDSLQKGSRYEARYTCPSMLWGRWCTSIYCSVWQCVAVWCSVLQCVAECCRHALRRCGAGATLHMCDMTHSRLRHRYTSICYSVLQCVAACCSVLQRVAVCCRHAFRRCGASATLDTSDMTHSCV